LSRKVKRRKTVVVEEEMPKGYKVCPKCDGNGRFRFRWSEPSSMNNPYYSDFHDCFECGGLGYVPENISPEKRVIE